MAVVSPMLDVMPQQTNPTRHPQIQIPRMMASRHEIVEEPPVQVTVQDKMYVAVGKELKENKSTVLWALHNSGGRKICLLHVHEPAQWIPLMGTKFPVSQLKEHQVKAYRETEKQDMNKLLREYSMICERAGVSTDVVHTTKDSIDKGIVELISQHSIKMLVMGAAADRHYSRKMMQTKSKKAAYVHLQAPLFCRILFVCKGHLVHTREGRLKGISTEVASPTLQANPNNETGQPSSLRSRSVTEGLTSSGPDYCRARSDIHGMRISTFSSDSSKGLTPHRSSNTLGSFNDWEEISSCPPLNSLEEASNALTPRFFSEFSFSEIEEATCNFDRSLKIGEGGYGSIYKGLLRHTQVAIKMLKSNSSRGPSEFQQEVNILSKLRHPNLVTLIGACPEFCILVYEYYPNGSLEDRLLCKDNTPPLTWQTRIRIAAELCSVLVFLHSCNPHSIVHGDLKPANILIYANLVSKLSDFGICRVLTQDESSSTNTTLCCGTAKGTLLYMDPEFLSTGELTPKSNVYSFGIILLQLLTGRSATGIAREVQYALDKGSLKNLLDSTAGDWPFVQAKQLAHLAIRCCEMNRRNRPDLASEVWRVLEPMRASCGAPSSFRMSSKEHC